MVWGTPITKKLENFENNDELLFWKNIFFLFTFEIFTTMMKHTTKFSLDQENERAIPRCR